jgi:hypothetical protein
MKKTTLLWAAVSMTALLAIGCGGNNQTTCTPGELQCAADGSSVQECAADGSGFRALATCDGEKTCQDLGQGPTCTEGGQTGCTAGEQRCSADGNIEACAADGSAFETVTECGAEEACAEFVQGTPSCGPATCTGNARFCYGGDVWSCSGGSVSGTHQDCDESANQACVVDAGVATCKEVVCTPGEVQCSETGNVVECDANGAGFTTRETCSGGQTCRDDLGGDPACAEAGCTAGERRCSADGNIEVCSSDGSGFELERPCGEGATCTDDGNGPQCGPESCENNQAFCYGGNIWVCSAGMPVGESQECDASANEECVVQGGFPTCAAIACTPDEVRCSLDGTSVEVCNSAGTAYTVSEACSSNICNDNNQEAACVVACNPGDLQCTSDNSGVEECAADGSKYNLLTTCPGEQTCQDDGQGPSCADGPAMCTPGEQRCAADGNIEQCNADGLTYSQVEACGAGEVCGEYVMDAPECGPDNCTGNDRFCYGGDVWRCTGGTVTGTFDRCDDATELCAVVSGVAQCQTPVCAPGELRCDSTGYVVRQCNADGTGFMNLEICQGGDVCRSVGNGPECGAPPCTPGEIRCSASGDVEQCAPDGLSHIPAEVCGADETCRVVSNTPQCGPASCTGNARFCFEGDVWSCGGGTPTIIYDDCDPSISEECVVQAGVAQCRVPACAPGETRCDPAGQIIQTCKANGTGFENSLICSGDNVCRDDLGPDPVCAQAPCTPGELRCSVNGDIEECAQDGNSYAVSTACGAGTACGVYGGVPQCGPDSCSGNARFCFEGDVWACSNNTPTSLFDTCDLAAGEECVREAGVSQCKAITCTPGEVRCSPGGDIVQTCNANGTGFDNTTVCQGSPVCRDIGNGPECGAALCTPGESRCVSGGTAVEVCDSTQQFVAAETCGTNELCEQVDGASTCVPQPICQPGVRQCNGAGDEIEECAPDGLSYVTYATCDASEACDIFANNTPECGPASCSGNTRFCFEGDVWSCSGGNPTGINDVCGASEQCLLVSGVYQCATVVCTPGETRCTASDDIEECNASGTGYQPATNCTNTEVCVEGGGSATCVDGSINCQPGYRYNGVSCADIDECAEGTSQCAAICQNTPGSFDCVSSVSDTSSPYWSESCPLSQQLSTPTNLIADCRCSTNASLTGGLSLCWRPYEVTQRAPQDDFGAGVRPASHPQVKILGGFFDNSAREIVAVVDWSGSQDPDAGFIMAFDVDTQDRRVISGRYIDNTGASVTKGQGPAFADVKDVLRGSTGDLFVLQGTLTRTEVLRVNATTGDRTLAWARDDANFGQCDNGRDGNSVQVRPEGFALGAGGEFYMSFSNTGLVGEGIGVIEISSDGTMCDVVTRSGAGPQNGFSGQDVGTGSAFTSGTLRGFALRNGELYALNNFDHTMYAIDLSNGNRRRETSANSSSTMGTGPTNSGGLGHRWAKWDNTRNVWWTVGRLGDTQLILVEPGTGDRHDLYCPGGSSTFAGAACVEGSLAAGLSLNYGGFWFDPADSDIVYFAHDAMGIVKYEVSTGNSIVWSM